MRRVISVRLALAGCVVAGLAGGAWGISSALSSSSVPADTANYPASESLRARTENASYKATPITVVSPRETELFGVFRQSSSTPMPAKLVTKLQAGPFGQGFVAEKIAPNLNLAHLATLHGGTPQIWLVPGDEAMCIVAVYSGDDGGSTCQSGPDMLNGHLALIRGDAGGKVTVIGVVPDGIAAVTVASPNSTSRTVPVSNNVFIAEGLEGTANITFDGGHIAVPGSTP